MASSTPPTPLWDAFNLAWTAALGKPASAFTWVPATTPFATFKETAAMLAMYYATIFGGRALMRGRPAFELKLAFMLHNFLLTALSGGLLALFVEQLAPALWHGGVYDAVCTKAAGWTPQLTLLYYLNYLTKYVEFIDTVFLVLKKKPLTFLHTYHHGATALLCYVQLMGETPVSWVPITLNLTVHCVMYWYYFQSARGVRIWWKEYITVMQIVQFVIDLGFVYFTSYTLFADQYFPSLPHVGSCAGAPIAAVTGVAILTSYLFLFIAFYFATYKRKQSQPKKQQSAEHTRSKSVEQNLRRLESMTSYALHNYALQKGADKNINMKVLTSVVKE